MVLVLDMEKQKSTKTTAVTAAGHNKNNTNNCEKRFMGLLVIQWNAMLLSARIINAFCIWRSFSTMLLCSVHVKLLYLSG